MVGDEWRGQVHNPSAATMRWSGLGVCSAPTLTIMKAILSLFVLRRGEALVGECTTIACSNQRLPFPKQGAGLKYNTAPALDQFHPSFFLPETSFVLLMRVISAKHRLFLLFCMTDFSRKVIKNLFCS